MYYKQITVMQVSHKLRTPDISLCKNKNIAQREMTRRTSCQLL